jgi:hypothetical protein
MRFFEFGTDGTGDDKLLMVLRNYIGKASSKKIPSKLTWETLNRVLRASGFPIGADYESFKAMYDASVALQNIVTSFDDKGVALKVPGAPGETGDGTNDARDSEEEVARIASAAAPKQVAQNQAGIQV